MALKRVALKRVETRDVVERSAQTRERGRGGRSMKGLLQLWLLRSRLASGQEFSRTRLILATVGQYYTFVMWRASIPLAVARWRRPP